MKKGKVGRRSVFIFRVRRKWLNNGLRFLAWRRTMQSISLFSTEYINILRWGGLALRFLLSSLVGVPQFYLPFINSRPSGKSLPGFVYVSAVSSVMDGSRQFLYTHSASLAAFHPSLSSKQPSLLTTSRNDVFSYL